MPSSTSPSMGLFLPIPGTTAGPQWATETTANWSTLDTHDHTTGKGVQIPIAALNVNADFSWLTFGQTNVGYLSLVDKLATGNLTVNASLGNVAGDPYWRNASGVVKKIGLAGDPLTLASGTSLLGSLLMTAIAAPGSPAAGFGSLYFDSTATNIAVKNSAGVVKHGVQTKAAVGSQWLTSIADDGSSVLAQPAFSDISGSIVSGTAVSGSLLMTAIAAPGTPAAGKVIAWVDSTTRNWSTKDQFGNVSVSAFPTVGVASQWFSAMNASGVFTSSQPAFTDISGSIAIGQIANSLITYAKIQNVSATSTFLGRKSAGAGIVEEVSNTGASAGRIGTEVLIDIQSPSGVATITSASWIAGTYRKIRVVLKGTQSSNGYQRLQMNADSATTYTDIGSDVNGAGSPSGDSANNGTNGFVRLGILNTAATPGEGFTEFEFDPRTDTHPRSGKFTSLWYANTGTAASHLYRSGAFMYNNTATNITFITLTSGGPTWTGSFEVWGVPA